MSPTATTTTWSPQLDLTAAGMRVYDPDRVVEAIAKGRRTGYEAGYAAGRAEAAAETQRVVTAVTHEANQLLDAIATAAQRLATEESRAKDLFAEHVIDVALDLAAAILHRELSDDHHAATEALRRALAPLDLDPTATVRMHPDDVATLDHAEVPPEVRLVPDHAIARGDAIAVTPTQTVDARIDSAIARVRTALGGGE